MTQVLLTVDTEIRWRHYRRNGDWREALARSIEPAGVGLSWQLAMLARHGLKACFFVDPMPALVLGLDPIRQMVAPILAAGQEVQLHLHSFWHDLALGRSDEEARFELTDFDEREQCELIATAAGLLMDAGAPRPIAFRSGSFAADQRTLRALAANGIRFDSSHNGADHPWPSGLPFPADLLDPTEREDVVELPITSVRLPGGGLRPFQICALSWREMQATLAHAADWGQPIVNIVSHSFELASQDGSRVNRLVAGRFERLCRHLADRRSALPTAFIASLTRVGRTGEVSRPLDSGRWQVWARMAQQACGDLVAERLRLPI